MVRGFVIACHQIIVKQVHSHAELAHLFLADSRRCRQLYFDNKRAAALKSLEHATNVETVVENILHQNFVMHTCDDVIAEYIQSANYDVFKSNEENVVALVKRKNDGQRPFRPFRFSQVRKIMQCNDRIDCSCCATIVHGRPCRHLLAYNEGALEPSDFSHVHTKVYAAKLVHSNEQYYGVVNRRRNLNLPEYHEDVDEAEEVSTIPDGEHASGDYDFATPKPERKAHGFRQLQQEFKRFMDKWGNIPRALQSLCQKIREHDVELGDVADYRSGRGSSKPTPQASRSKV